MEVLLTGNISFVTQQFIETAFPDDHVLVAKMPEYKTADGEIQTVDLTDKNVLRNLTETYAFDKIVYFSAYLTPHTEQMSGMESLRQTLQCCYENPLQMVYVAGPEASYKQTTGKTILARSAVELCRQYTRANHMELKVLKSPYIYTAKKSLQYTSSLFEEMEKGRIKLDEAPAQMAETLCSEDLAVLLYRMFDHWTPEYEELRIPDVFHYTVADVMDELEKLRAGLKVVYGDDEVYSVPPNDDVLRRRYFWFPQYDFIEDLPNIYQNWQKSRVPKEKGFKRAVKKLMGHGKLLVALETLTLFVITEGLTRLDNSMIQFRTVDFRLLFVVMIATIHGLTPGIIAAAMATLALLFSYMAEGVSWIAMFYEPSNWLAFIAYFIVGATCGYVELRNKENIGFIRKENERLRERVTFIRRIYQDTLEDKRQYRRQLLGRKDSFGKIYSITRELESLQPNVLFSKTIEVFESVLENRTIAIYSIDGNQAYARLEASSAGIERTAERSLRMKDVQDVAIAIEQEGVWVNRELKPNLPMYAAGVRSGGHLLVLITVAEAKADQMNLYVQNLFRILCGLVETALLRAYEYQRMARSERYIGETCLMKPKAFMERLRVANEMQEKKIAGHILLKLDVHGDANEQIDEKLARRIRANDAAGYGADGECYLLLNQAREEHYPMILERMRTTGYAMQKLTRDEEIALLQKMGE